MISNRIKITEEGEVYDRKEIALAIRNSTYNDELKCSLMDQNIIKNCETCSLKFICDGIDGLADDYIKNKPHVFNRVLTTIAAGQTSASINSAYDVLSYKAEMSNNEVVVDFSSTNNTWSITTSQSSAINIVAIVY